MFTRGTYNQEMKCIVRMIAVLVLLGAAFAAERPMEKGTLVSVVLHDTSSLADNYPDAQPGRVPPGPITYTYEFTIRQGCVEYHGLFDSYHKRFVEDFKPGEQVGVRSTKRLLYVQAHGQSETLRMSLSSRHEIANCAVSK
jgi:hypothetical protein